MPIYQDKYGTNLPDNPILGDRAGQAIDYVPLMAVTYWGFRLMIGFGALAAFAAVVALWMTRKGTVPKSKWLMRLALLGILAPFAASAAGWVFTEIGRQPFVVAPNPTPGGIDGVFMFTASAVSGLEEIRPLLQKLSAKVLDLAARLPPCKQPYERYLNPFEVLAINGRLLEMPDAAALRKLKQRVIQQIKLNDGHADWLEGAEIGESRVRHVLDDLDDDSGLKPRLHWVIYECPELNRLLSLSDPRCFAFFADPLGPPPHGRPPYWQMRDKTCSDEAFFAFIHPPFLCSFEALLAQALELNDAELIQALSAGRLPVVDVFDYFRRANKWMEAKASEIKGVHGGLRH